MRIYHLLLAACCLAPAAADVDPKALAEVLFRAPVATRVQVSPDGKCLLFNMPDDEGNIGLLSVETASYATGEKPKSHILEPDDGLEVGHFGWAGSDLIVFNQRLREAYATGFNLIDRAFEEQRSFSNTRDKIYQDFKNGLPAYDHRYATLVQDKNDASWADRHLLVNHLRPDVKGHRHRHCEVFINDEIITEWILGEDGHPLLVRLHGESGYYWPQPRKSRREVFKLKLEQFSYELDPVPATEFERGDYLFAADFPEQRLLMGRYDDEGYEYLQFFDLETRSYQEATYAVEGWDATGGVIRAQAGGRLLGLLHHTEKPEYLWFDPKLAKLHAQLQRSAPGMTVHVHGLVNDEKGLILSVQSDLDPGRLVYLNLEQGGIEHIIACRPWVEKLPPAPQQSVWFDNRNGDRIHAYLTLPPGRKDGEQVPVVALTHGGPHVRDTWGYDPEVKFLALLGYAVLQVNYRGSDGFGDTYELDARLIEAAEAAPQDVVDGIRWLVGEGVADPDRIALVGSSFGAFVSLAIAAQEPDLPACVVGFAGVYDLALMVEEDREEEKAFVVDYYADFETEQERYRELSPVYRGADIKAPVLLVHGREDGRVSSKQAKVMRAAIRKGDAPVRAVIERYLQHGIGNNWHRVEHYARLGRFLQEHMGE